MFDGEGEEEGGGGDKQLCINKGYAKIYNDFRQKEEFNKLKTKYGQHLKDLESSGGESESTSEDDEDGTFPEEVEKDFYKTLACLKNKDPKIYDSKVEFFEKNNDPQNSSNSSKKSKKEKKLFLRDYERKIILERGGKLSEDEDEENFEKKFEKKNPTYIEEQKLLKENISKILASENSESDSELFLRPKVKSEEEKKSEENDYKSWLKGKKIELEKTEEKNLKPLRDFWTDPNLDKKERFLRDYILEKKFLTTENYENFEDKNFEKNENFEENFDEDEKILERQEEFEHKYNFRFEEPDAEFLKRYPRTIENSLRKPDTKRAEKRAEVRKRKEEEKVRRKEELKQLKAIKRKEIMDKIAMLKDITGNDDIQFDALDLEGDFDPAEHDRKMQKMFDEGYYAEPEDDVKPEFPDIDEELGIERNWDDYDPNNEEFVPDCEEKNYGGAGGGETHCEDPEFNMDADYDPSKALQSELIDASRKKKKRRRSKFAEVMAKAKPKFDAKIHSSYKDYIEQYYALDYEDMIDDLPCRFKYRKVVPNDYGLTVEEILTAEDHELNKWCSLKKALEHKPESMEHYEVRAYQQKARNEEYKKKIFRSLYAPKEEPLNPEIAIASGSNSAEEPKRKRKKKKKKNSEEAKIVDPKLEKIDESKTEKNSEKIETEEDKSEKSTDFTAKKGKKRKTDENDEKLIEENSEKPKKKKSKIENPENSENLEKNSENLQENSEKLKKKKSKIENPENLEKNSENLQENSEKPKKKKSKIENPESVPENSENLQKNSENLPENSEISAKKSKKNKREKMSKNPENIEKNSKKNKKNSQGTKNAGKKLKKSGKGEKPDQVALLSEERLKAYGLNPKKFRNKLKYGKKN